MNDDLFSDQPAPQAPTDDLFSNEPAPEAKSLAGFGKNLWEDVKGTAAGVGGLAKGLMTQPVETATEFATGIGPAIFKEGQRIGVGKLLTGHPVQAVQQFGEAAYEKPLTTTLDVLPAAGAAGKALGFGGKAARGAKLAAEAGEVAEMAKGAELAATPMEAAAEFATKKFGKTPTASFVETLPSEYKAAVTKAQEGIAGQPTSKSLFVKEGVYQPERQAIHQGIEGAPEFNNPKAVAAPGTKPKAVLVIGPTASGKSSIIKNQYKGFLDNAIEIDNDLIKEKLPGYDPKKAGLFHAESGDIESNIIKNAMRNRMNFVDSVIGKNSEKYVGFVNELKKAGYDVDLVFVDLAPEKAAFRAVERLVHNPKGRYVAPEYILENVGLKPGATYDRLKMEVDNYARYQADVPRGQGPVLVERGGRGRGEGGRIAGGGAGSESGTGSATGPIPTAEVTPPKAGVSPETPGIPTIEQLKSKIPPEIVTPLQKAGEWAKTKYTQAAEKPGIGETFGKYFKQHARNMAMKAAGAAPGQIRKIGLDQAEKLADYLLDKKLVSSGLGDIGRAEKVAKLNQEAGQMVGDMRALATNRGAVHNMPALVEEIKAKILPKYSRGVKAGESSQVVKALDEIQMTQPTPDKVAQTITALFQESKKMDRLKQPSGAYADVARELRRANEDLMSQFLKPDEVKAYHNALEEYGATTQIKEFIKRKESFEMGGRLGPGSGISRMMVQKAFDTVGYRTEAQIANRMAKWFKSHPNLPASPKDIFRKYIDEAAEAVDEMINPME